MGDLLLIAVSLLVGAIIGWRAKRWLLLRRLSNILESGRNAVSRAETHKQMLNETIRMLRETARMLDVKLQDDDEHTR